jgi:alkylation response protein AidB-like acyl-CoA dehydrogenase
MEVNGRRRIQRHRLRPAQQHRRPLHRSLRHAGAEGEIPAADGARRRSIGAIAMSEPAAGSDLQGIKTTAIRQDDGSFLLNGSKTFITNGWHCDLVIVVAKTDPAAGAMASACCWSSVACPVSRRESDCKKLGLKAQDTSELFFDNVRVPAEQVLGGAGHGGQGLRLPDAGAALGAAADRDRRRCCGAGRHRPHGGLREGTQDVRRHGGRFPEHALHAGRAADRGADRARVRRQMRGTGAAGQLDTATASMAKYWCSDLQCKVMDECLQLFGGYGFMWEYPITRAFRRRPGAAHLRRHQRDHEGSHHPVDGSGRPSSGGGLHQASGSMR